MVTPLLPRPDATNAGALVMRGHLDFLRAHHEVTLATFAEPTPVENRTVEQVHALGVRVHVVHRTGPGGIERWKRRGRIGAGWLTGGLPLHVLESADPRRRMQRLIARLLREEPFDLLQVETHVMGGFRYRPRPPAVLIEHDVGFGGASDGRTGAGAGVRRTLREAEMRRLRRYEAKVWPRYDRIQVFTERDAAAIRESAPALTGRVRVNPFGIELPPMTDPAREDADAVVFNGSFAHPPNVDAALWLGREIMPLLRARRPGVRLSIVGESPPDAVRNLAGEDIAVTGRVPAVEPYLERAAVVLAPIRLGGGMRRKVLQGMATGKAVVATPAGAEGIAVEGSLPPLIVARNAEEIADATAQLLADADARRALGERARAFVARHHSWSRYEQRLDALYAGLLDARTTR